MIQSALRYGYAQPWMYEGLGLAMQAANQPKSEIERALMSAVDFATSTDELMHAALYMSRIGLETRWLRAVAAGGGAGAHAVRAVYARPRDCRRINDLDAIRWTCTGVLSRAWTDDKLDVLQRARHLATATLERLRKEKKTEQAERPGDGAQRGLGS